MFGFFDHIVVVNLPERVDRRRESEAELQLVGGERATFFAAVRPATPGFFRTIGEHGCFLSHVAVLKNALAARNILVMEDDVMFARSLHERAASLADLPADWDVIYVGHNQLPEVRVELPGGSLVAVDRHVEFVGTHCYAVNGPVVSRLLAYCEGLLARAAETNGTCMPIDGAINTARRELGLRTFAFNPPLADQRPSRTDVAPHKWFDGIPPLQSTINALRRVKGHLTRRS